MGKFLDAALNGAMGYAGKAYFFKGAKYVRYDWTKDQGDPGYPLGLDEWGFPAPFDKGIDAAIEGREAYEKKAFFFKDDKYLKYDWAGDGKVESGYPKSIDLWELPKDFFAGGKKKIDAVVNGAGESARYCYLLSGSNWVRIDWKEEEDPVLHKGSLQADWGLPAEIAKGIDAALSGAGKKYGGKAYFFADKKYARFDWSADKCDLTNGNFDAWNLTWESASPGPAQPQGKPGSGAGGMHQSVRDKYMEFTTGFEGRVSFMYADVKQLVTTGIGNLIDPVDMAVGLPWIFRKDQPKGTSQEILAKVGTPATKEEIKAEWQVVKDEKSLAKKGHKAAALVTHLGLTDDAIDKLVLAKNDENAKYLAKTFKDFAKFPADAQLACLSMAWGVGPGWPTIFKNLAKSVHNADWAAAAEECKMKEEGNPGVIPRNKADKLLFNNAAAVAASGGDITKLWWPNSPPQKKA